MRHSATILLLFLVLSILGTSKAFGQYHRPYQKPGKNVQSLYLELFGNGIFYSFNYDFITKSHFGTRFGVGYDFLTYFSNDPINRNNSNNPRSQSWTLLAMENYYLGNGWLRLELGMGGVVGHIGSDLAGKLKVKPPGLTFTTGLRFLPTRNNPISFKIAFTPFIAHGHFYPYAGVSIGWGVDNLF